MRLRLFVVVCIIIIAVLSGCNAKKNSEGDLNKQGHLQHPVAEQSDQSNEPVENHQSEEKSKGSGKTPPLIDHLDNYPFPVQAGWKEEKFEIRKYDEGMDWEAVFTFDGDVRNQAIDYKEVIEDLGYEIQTLLDDVFKIGAAEIAGVTYHGTFTFGLGDEYSEWGEGQGYVNISFTEKQ